MVTTNNRSWKALLPRNGGIGVCPQIGRVKIPPVCPRSTLNLTGGRRIKTVRKELESLRGGETVEFIGRPCEWHDMSGQNYYIVIVTDMDVIGPESFGNMSKD